MSRRPNIGYTKCPTCAKVVAVTGLRRILAHWAGVNMRCQASGQLAGYIAPTMKEAQR